tara:strand:+ start:713 stop:1177 length:465 start_codon:yes stop_codon:yes gene_type:complete
MIKTLLFILLFSTSVFAAASDSSDDTSASAPDQIQSLYNKAYDLVYAEKFDKSLKLLKKISKRNDLGEMKADIYNLLGFSYRKSDNPDLNKAFESYEIALEANPKHAGAHEYLGELYLKMGKKSMAEEMLAKLEVIAGTNSDEYKKLKKAIANS